MITNRINLFIVDDNRLMVNDLKLYLLNTLEGDVKISIFDNGESCLDKLDSTIEIVILDYNMGGKNGLDILKEIKKLSPKTEVIMLSNNEDIVLAIKAFRAGAKDYVLKGHSAWKKIALVINQLITEPIRILVREFGVSKFMAVFLLTFVSIGFVVLCALLMMYY